MFLFYFLSVIETGNRTQQINCQQYLQTQSFFSISMDASYVYFAKSRNC